MLMTSPIAIYMQRFDEPPELKNGSVMPMQGRSFKHIPIFMIACEPIITAVP